MVLIQKIKLTGEQTEAPLMARLKSILIILSITTRTNNMNHQHQRQIFFKNNLKTYGLIQGLYLNIRLCLLNDIKKFIFNNS